MKQNLGIVDRVLRFALSFWWLGPWPLRFDSQIINWVIIAIAWIALIESFLGYCLLHDIFGIRTKEQ